VSSTLEHQTGDQAVSFYDGAERLTELVIPFLVAAVRDGDTVIVIATESHRALLTAALDAAGVDVHAARCANQVRLFDAAEMLSRFMVGAVVDRRAFMDSVGQCVREARAEGRPVRAFGEMVPLLWAEGNRSAAIEVETMWSRLGTQIPASLFEGRVTGAAAS
jgi:KaiC/GvpD/RAD55 family RecA-like ATPase